MELILIAWRGTVALLGVPVSMVWPWDAPCDFVSWATYLPIDCLKGWINIIRQLIG